MGNHEAMKQYAIEHGTWEDLRTESDPEELVPVHITSPLPRPVCEDAKRFVENLPDIVEMKLGNRCSNSEIAKRFGIRRQSVARLVR